MIDRVLSMDELIGAALAASVNVWKQMYYTDFLTDGNPQLDKERFITEELEALTPALDFLDIGYPDVVTSEDIANYLKGKIFEVTEFLDEFLAERNKQ